MGPTIRRARCQGGVEISQEALESLDPVRLHSMRHKAIAAQKAGLAEPYWCEVCGQRLWPKLDVTRRPIWAHLADPFDASRFCPLMETRLTYEQLDARLYRGRQEGPLHRRILDELEIVARLDRWVNASSIRREQYLPATVPAFSGRFPDLYFSARGRDFVFEIQTAPITVHRLIERGQFYAASGIQLIWITWSFDPKFHTNAWYWDLLSANLNTLFSVDDELIGRARNGNSLLMRRFKVKEGGGDFDVDVVGLPDLDSHLWALDLKERWISAASRRMQLSAVPFDELTRIAGITVDTDSERWALAETTNVLIALECGRPVGRASENIVGQVNAFLNSEYGLVARGIIQQALTNFQAELYGDRESVQKAIERANRRATTEKPTPAWTRADKIGRIRDVLFPTWRLRPLSNRQ